MNAIPIIIVIILLTLFICGSIIGYVFYRKNADKSGKARAAPKTAPKTTTKPPSKTTQAPLAANTAALAPAPLPPADEVPEPGSLRVGSSGIGDSKAPSRASTEEFLPGQGEFKSTIPDPV